MGSTFEKAAIATASTSTGRLSLAYLADVAV